MAQTKLCKGDRIILLRCGANAREREAKVAYANDMELVPVVKLLGFLPIWLPIMGIWCIVDEGRTWRLKEPA
jgi:hypothetical protein